MPKNDFERRMDHYDKLSVPAGHYRCANCYGVFEKGRSDAEAEAERLEKFPDVPVSEMVVVCDDCFNAMEAYFAAHPEALQ